MSVASVLERDIMVAGPFAAPVSVDQVTYFETLGEPFTCELDLESESPDIDLSGVVGQPVTVTISLGENGVRFVNGYVTRMSLGGTFDRRARYHATVRPWLFLMSGRRNSRIFQQQSILDVAKALFREQGFSDFEESLDETYAAKDYIVQYQESNFAFVSRLLEGAGISYYFRHEDGKHTLVLTDSISGHETVSGYEAVAFHPEGSGRAEADETISRWQVTHQWRSGAFATTDYDFEKPRANLLSVSNTNARHAFGDLEIFDYPGGFSVAADGSTHARVRLEELQSDVELAHGGGNVRGLGTGNLFAFTEFPIESQNKKYLIVSSSFSGTNAPHDSGDADGGEFAFSFTALNADVPFRPPLATARPRVQGPQTAVVVGPQGEEIYVDNYGRVKIQFFWDREGKDDEKSSCWVRVSQAWAGAKWGSVHLPRIGQEVIVDFLEGDPDRPIITGRVYNNDQMPPYDLPANKTQSGIKSRSTPKGGPNNFNELRFEDRKGSELVSGQAEKDLAVLVKNDESRSVGHDRTSSITHDETLSVGNNRSTSIGKNEITTIGAAHSVTIGTSETVKVGSTRTHSIGTDESLSVGGKQTITVAAKQTESVGADQALDVGGGRTVNVGKSDSLTVGAALAIKVGKDQTLDVGKTLVVTVADQITIQTGSASIVMKKNGDITLKGKNISLEGTGDVTIKASGNVTIKGTKVSSN
jgi:type VI secretion system secreted protein VgrG